MPYDIVIPYVSLGIIECMHLPQVLAGGRKSMAPGSNVVGDQSLLYRSGNARHGAVT